MRGLLGDENVEGHLISVRQLIKRIGLLELLEGLPVEFAAFHDLRLTPGMDDRPLWEFCQRDSWVLFTANRNHEDPTSLEATIAEKWRPGLLPVLTIANKSRFERERAYAEKVAAEVAELLFGIHGGEYCDQPRIYVPR